MGFTQGYIDTTHLMIGKDGSGHNVYIHNYDTVGISSVFANIEDQDLNMDISKQELVMKTVTGVGFRTWTSHIMYCNLDPTSLTFANGEISAFDDSGSATVIKMNRVLFIHSGVSPSTKAPCLVIGIANIESV